MAGVVGLSGWLPIHKKFEEVLSHAQFRSLQLRKEANFKTPMYQAHGTDDMVVQFKFGEMTHQRLKDLDIDVKFTKVDGMGHEADPEELADLGKWLKDRIGNPEMPKETEEVKEAAKA